MNITNVFLFCSLLLVVPVQAHAYIDAGTGSIMLQVLLAGVAGLAMFVKMYWQRLMVFFRGAGTGKVSGKES